jgi:putative hemolysin
LEPVFLTRFQSIEKNHKLRTANNMKDIPVPTLGLSPTDLPRGVLHCPSEPSNSTMVGTYQTEETAAKPAPALEVVWAQHLDEVRAAQRLRYTIFAEEMGARLDSPVAMHDVDRFDDYCEHLLVRDVSDSPRHGLVVGTYRLLTPVQAQRAGGLYTETEFNISALDCLRPSMMEIGRSCVHEDYRSGAVIMALWSAMGQFMLRNKLDSLVGCASIPMQGASDGIHGNLAASVWRKVSERHLADPAWHVHAHTPLPVDELDSSLDAEPPVLIKGYLRMGAKVLGAPAWDPDFNTADLPMIIRLDDLPSRHRKHFLGTA